MNVEAVMTKDVKTCRAGDALSVPARLMWDHDCGCIPVLDCDDRVIGMITDRDICMAAYTQNRAISDILVDSAMAKDVHSCGPQDSLEAAEHTMRQQQVRRLPVLGFEGHLIGLLSLNDLARAVAEKKRDHSPGMSPVAIEATLAAVCRPRRGSADHSLAAPIGA